MTNTIKIEGLDGSGKTSVLAALAEYLRTLGFKVLSTGEYGAGVSPSSPLAVQLRQLVSAWENTLDDVEYEILMTLISRRFNLYDIGRMGLFHDFLLVDRSQYANLAYGLPLCADLKWIYSHLMTQDERPHQLVVWLDTDINVCMERLQRKGALSRNEQRGFQYYEKVREVFVALAEDGKLVRVDGNRSVQEIVRDLVTLVVATST